MLRVCMSVLLCLGASSCVDSRSRFDQFTDRKAEMVERDLANLPDGGCSLPATLEQFGGRYLFAMAAKPAPDRPILALLTVIPGKGDKPGGRVEFEPLAIEDPMSTVGVKNEGTFELAGTEFEAPTFPVVLPGNANPVQAGLNAEADLTLSGSVCLLEGKKAVDSFCGTAAGNITVPLTLPLEGSTFGAIRIEEGKPWPTSFASCEQAVEP